MGWTAEKANRLNKYLVENDGDLRALLIRLEAALDVRTTLQARRTLQDLAQHHTDLENAIEGNS